MKFGKLPPKLDPRTFKLGNYYKTGLPQIPPTCDFYEKGTNWGMLGNDRYSDCAFAAVGHAEQNWTANATTQIPVDDQSIVNAYLSYTGGQDRGSVLLDVLKIWRKTGIIKHKIDAFIQVEDFNQVKAAIHLFGGLYIGLALPNYIIKNPIGATWSRTTFAPPNPNNGHCVQLVGYDKKNIYCITWGKVKAMSVGFLKKYMDEAYAILSPDWIANGHAPNGFDYITLQQDLQTL